MSDGKLNFFVTCPKCEKREKVLFEVPEMKETKTFGGIPLPSVKKEEIFSLSYNHDTHTLIVNFLKDGTVQSCQTMERIDRSLEGLSARPVQQGINLAEGLENECFLLIVSKLPDMWEIMRMMSALFLKNIPSELNFRSSRTSNSFIIDVGKLRIALFKDTMSHNNKIFQRPELYLLLDARNKQNTSINIQPPKMFILVNSLTDLTDPSNTELMNLIDTTRPTAFFQGKTFSEIIDSISNILVFIEQAESS